MESVVYIVTRTTRRREASFFFVKRVKTLVLDNRMMSLMKIKLYIVLQSMMKIKLYCRNKNQDLWDSHEVSPVSFKLLMSAIKKVTFDFSYRSLLLPPHISPWNLTYSLVNASN